jgi:hypothetical protein
MHDQSGHEGHRSQRRIDRRFSGANALGRKRRFEGNGGHGWKFSRKTLPIPIPPPKEQKKIIARLDAMRVKLDELQRLQREVEAELASFTPALLAKAFRGEL